MIIKTIGCRVVHNIFRQTHINSAQDTPEDVRRKITNAACPRFLTKYCHEYSWSQSQKIKMPWDAEDQGK